MKYKPLIIRIEYKNYLNKTKNSVTLQVTGKNTVYGTEEFFLIWVISDFNY